MSKRTIRVEIEGEMADLINLFPRNMGKGLVKGLLRVALKTDEGIKFVENLIPLSRDEGRVRELLETIKSHKGRKKDGKKLEGLFEIDGKPS